MRTLVVVLWCVSSVVWAAEKPAEKPAEKGKAAEAAPKYAALTPEQILALAKTGDAKVGAAGYEVCAGCHLPTGAGRPDGAFPQLAGQHPVVLVKQLADMRAGVRDNPVMHPFAIALTDAKLADVSAYIATLPVPHDNGLGRGDTLAVGMKLYERDCKSCHGGRGEGDAAKLYPVLAGQHYKYLLRQATDIRDGKRRNANPDMVKVIARYTDKEIDTVVDYMSRLNMPKPKP